MPGVRMDNFTLPDGVYPRAICLLRRHWDRLTMVARSVRYFGAPFNGQCGVTKVYPLSPKIFNGLVDVVLRYWITMVESMEETVDPSIVGFGRYIHWMAAYLYVDDGLLARGSGPNFATFSNPFYCCFLVL